MKRLLAAALLAASVLTAAGCASSHPHAAGNAGRSTGTANLSAAAFPVTIPNAFGATTIASNLTDMFMRITPANDIDRKFGVAAPTLAIEGMTLAGS